MDNNKPSPLEDELMCPHCGHYLGDTVSKRIKTIEIPQIDKCCIQSFERGLKVCAECEREFSD